MQETGYAKRVANPVINTPFSFRFGNPRLTDPTDVLEDLEVVVVVQNNNKVRRFVHKCSVCGFYVRLFFCVWLVLGFCSSLGTYARYFDR